MRRWTDRLSWTARGRRAVAGVGLYAIAHGLETIAYMAMVPLITRSVSLTAFGQLTLLLVGAQVVMMSVDAGVGVALVREVATEKDLERRHVLIATTFWFRVVVATAAALLIFAGSFFATSPMREALQLGAPTLFFWSMCGGFIEIFRSLERHGEMAIAGALRSVVWTAMILTLVVSGGHELVGLVWSYGVSYGVACVLLCWRIGWKAVNRRPDASILRGLLRFGVPVGSYYVLRAVGGLDRYLVRHRTSVADAGLVQIGSIPGGALEILERVVILPAEPYIYGVPVEERARALTRLVRMSAYVMGAGASVLSMFAPEMVAILAPASYADALSVIAWYTFASIHRSIARLLCLGAGLVGNTRMWVVGAAVELLIAAPALYFILPITGIAGAGMARYLAAVLSLIYSYKLLRRLWLINLPIGSICFYTTLAPLVATLFATAHFGVVAPLPVRILIAALLVAAGYPIIMRPPGRRFTRRKRGPR